MEEPVWLEFLLKVICEFKATPPQLSAHYCVRAMSQGAARGSSRGGLQPEPSSCMEVVGMCGNVPLNITDEYCHTRFLNTSRDSDTTTSLSSLFQCLTTLSFASVQPSSHSAPSVQPMHGVVLKHRT